MTTTPNQTTREEISGALERAIDRIMGVEVPAMNGDNLAVTLCSAFDDPDQEADDETGWTEAATDGYEQVCAAIRALFDPVVQSLAALQSPTDREGDRLLRAIASAPDAACTREETAWEWRDQARKVVRIEE